MHLYDGTWYHTCYNFLECEFRNNPREGWYDDARYDGVSADGQVATFQYGPVETPGKRTQGGMRGWPGEEWKKLPVGVQVSANLLGCVRAATPQGQLAYSIKYLTLTELGLVQQ
jgi:hypothetical protein